jgi:hypothetical protein
MPDLTSLTISDTTKSHLVITGLGASFTSLQVPNLATISAGDFIIDSLTTVDGSDITAIVLHITSVAGSIQVTNLATQSSGASQSFELVWTQLTSVGDSGTITVGSTVSYSVSSVTSVSFPLLTTCNNLYIQVRTTSSCCVHLFIFIYIV